MVFMMMILCLIPDDRQNAQVPNQVLAENEVKVIWSAINANRLALRNGTYYGVGAKTFKKRDGTESITGEFTIDGSFDFLSGREMFRRKEPYFGVQKNDPKAVSAQYTVSAYIRNEKHVSVLRNNTIEIRSKNYIVNVAAIRPVDIRTIGFCDKVLFDERVSYERLFDVYKNNRTHDITKNGNFIVINSIYANGALNSETWWDTSKAYSPVKYTVKQKDISGKWVLIEECNTSWQEVEGVWVPKTLQIEEYNKNSPNVSYNLSFKWEVANSDMISRDQFEIRAMNPQQGARIIDCRTGKPVFIGIIDDIHKVSSLESMSSGISYATIIMYSVIPLVVVGVVFVLARRFWLTRTVS